MSDRPNHDEETLAKILEAAYVLQEHNRELKENPKLATKENPAVAKTPGAVASPQSSPKLQQQKSAHSTEQGFTLAQIVETQQKIRTQHLPFDEALSVIVERLAKISRASGAAIATLDGDNVQYRAVAGSLTLPAGSAVPLDTALCAACLRSGKVFRCDDVNPELRLDTEVCRQRGIGSLIAVPIFHNGGVAGALEVYYPGAHAFADQDVHTSQLIAGLVTEALARNEEVTWKQSLATERAVMLKALEKLKPNLAALADTPVAPTTHESAAQFAVPNLDVSSPVLCWKCGHQLVGQEQFCGNCGSPRSGGYEKPGLQSKVSAMWQMQQALKQSANSVDDAAGVAEPLVERLPEQKLPDGNSVSAFVGEPEPQSDLFSAAAPLPHDTFQPNTLEEAPASDELEPADFENPQQADLEIAPVEIAADSPEMNDGTHAVDGTPAQETALVKRESGTAWSSASSALDFLERAALAKNNRVWTQFWNTRRGDIYLAIAVVFVLGVIRWAIWSNHSVSAVANPTTATAAHRKPAPDADLSLFDRTLIQLGLADAPEPQEYKGNPRTQVWVDLHTALYYCPGADLYGKTPKGRFSSQRDAQLDSFEPAYRKACD